MTCSRKRLAAIGGIVVAIIGSLLAERFVYARSQERIVAAILDLRGEVTFDFEASDAIPPKKRRNDETHRLFTHFLHDVGTVTLAGERVTDGSFPDLGGLRHLESVELLRTRVSVKSIAQLRAARIRALAIGGGTITDDDMSFVGSLDTLERLYLADLRITDQGLEQLGVLQHLKLVDLTGLNVTTSGVDNLRSISSSVVAWDGERQ